MRRSTIVAQSSVRHCQAAETDGHYYHQEACASHPDTGRYYPPPHVRTRFTSPIQTDPHPFHVPPPPPTIKKAVASSAIPPMRKDVLAKCYGGDISRKKKLLNKQAKGKKRMKSMGKVNVPQEAFMAVLDLSND